MSTTATTKPVQKVQKRNNQQQQKVPTLPDREAKGPHAKIPEGMKRLSEGTANVLYKADQQTQVFYNPAMETNRDISIAMVNVFISILEKESKENKKQRILNEDKLPGILYFVLYPICF